MVAWRLMTMTFMFLAFGFMSGCSDVRTGGEAIETVVISGETFNLEVAADFETRNQGLMYRESVAEYGGMLFIYPRSEIQSYWMGNCLVDIDIIFLDAQGRITALHEMKAQSPRREEETEVDYRTRLPSYWSRYPSQFAIELRAGWLDRLGLHVDNKIELDLERLKTMAE